MATRRTAARVGRIAGGSARAFRRPVGEFWSCHCLRLQSPPLACWELPEEFIQLRRRLEARLGKRGQREYVQVLRLLETFRMEEVAWAVRDALRLRAISFDAVKHLLLCRIEQRPPRLDLVNYPHLPVAQVATTAAADYLALLTPVGLQEGSC